MIEIQTKKLNQKLGESLVSMQLSFGYLAWLAILLFIFSSFTSAVPQKFTSRTGHVHVESSNRFMDVVADNFQVYSELNPTTGKVSFTGLMKSFEFKLGALDRAFNSDRVDLRQYSKFQFDGEVSNVKDIDFDTPGVYRAVVKGNLLIGGYKRVTSAVGEIEVLPSGRLKADADFTIRIEESSMNTINQLMKEKLPSAVSLDTDKLGISRDIRLQLSANYRPRG